MFGLDYLCCFKDGVKVWTMRGQVDAQMKELGFSAGEEEDGIHPWIGWSIAITEAQRSGGWLDADQSDRKAKEAGNNRVPCFVDSYAMG